mmetsp:Transcript_38704/g.91316  ORF Transcript_38704/g.91316 Transcript_38704/m.91316 type:complete len:233 (-) Transcript_38704:4570-5268(-)
MQLGHILTGSNGQLKHAVLSSRPGSSGPRPFISKSTSFVLPDTVSEPATTARLRAEKNQQAGAMAPLFWRYMLAPYHTAISRRLGKQRGPMRELPVIVSCMQRWSFFMLRLVSAGLFLIAILLVTHADPCDPISTSSRSCDSVTVMVSRAVVWPSPVAFSRGISSARTFWLLWNKRIPARSVRPSKLATPTSSAVPPLRRILTPSVGRVPAPMRVALGIWMLASLPLSSTLR